MSTEVPPNPTPHGSNSEDETLDEGRPASFCAGCMSRRRFLGTGIQSVSAIAVGAAASSLLAACGPPGGSSQGGPTGVSVPNSSSNVYDFTFSKYPELQNPGGSIPASIQASSGTVSIYVTRVDAGTAAAVSDICTHAGCPLNPYDPNARDYVCPCHGSIFGPDGSVLQGPARQPLASYAAKVTATSIQVTVT